MRFVPGGVRQVWSREGREKDEGNEDDDDEEEEEEDESCRVRMFQTAKETGISSFVSSSLFSVLLDGTVMTFRNVLLPSNSFHPWTIWAWRQFQMSFLWDWMSGIR